MKDILQTVIESLDAKEKALGFDWRSSWFRVVPGSGGRVGVELSRIELLRAVEKDLPGFFLAESSRGLATMRSASGNEIVIRLSGEGRETTMWTVASVADLRRAPEHSGELVTQAIMGETMTLLERRGDWYFVRMEDDYHGWVRSWHVVETPWAEVRKFDGEVNARVGVSVGYVRSGPGEDSIPVSDVTAGTRLVTRPAGEGLSIVRLPGGKSGYFRAGLLCGLKAEGDPGKRIIDRAMGFFGIPYVWGGTSAKGFDCSGLVKRVFLMEGIDLPRDAGQQAEIGKYIGIGNIDRAAPADLLFFGEGGKITHVAISMGGGRFIHAYGDVRINSYRNDDSLFEEKLAAKLLFARSVIS